MRLTAMKMSHGTPSTPNETALSHRRACWLDQTLHLVRRYHGAGTVCRNGLSAAKAAIAPSKDKLVVAMPKPRERIQPLIPKLAKRNTTPERNIIESSAICGSAAAVDTLSSLGWLAARTALNVIPTVTGRKAT